MKDIARDLGVSLVAVSKALRNYSDIGPETVSACCDESRS